MTCQLERGRCALTVPVTAVRNHSLPLSGSCWGALRASPLLSSPPLVCLLSSVSSLSSPLLVQKVAFPRNKLKLKYVDVSGVVFPRGHLRKVVFTRKSVADLQSSRMVSSSKAAELGACAGGCLRE